MRRRIVLLLVLAGCGDSPAASIDAMADVDAAPLGTLRARLVPIGCPDALVEYLVTGADGTRGATQTGGEDWVEIPVAPGDVLTASVAERHHVVVGVAPGDEIEIPDFCTAMLADYFEVSWSEYPDALSYVVSDECGGSDTEQLSWLMVPRAGCAGPTGDFFLAARGSAGVSAWSMLDDAPFEEGAMLAFGPWQEPQAVMLSLTGELPRGESVDIELEWALGGTFWSLIHREWSAPVEDTVYVPPVGRILATAAVGGRGVMQWLGPSWSFTYANPPTLPGLAEVTFASQTVTWSPDPGTATDAIVVQLLGVGQSRWTVLLPPGATSFTFPPGIDGAVIVWLFDRPDITSYEQLRRLPARDLFTRTHPIPILPPADGGVMEVSAQAAGLLVSPHVPPNPAGPAGGPGRLQAVDVGRHDSRPRVTR